MGDTRTWVCGLAWPLSGCAAWGSDSAFLGQMRAMRALLLGTALVQVASNPSWPHSYPSPRLGQASPMGLLVPLHPHSRPAWPAPTLPIFPVRLWALGGQGRAAPSHMVPGMHGPSINHLQRSRVGTSHRATYAHHHPHPGCSPLTFLPLWLFGDLLPRLPVTERGGSGE